MKIEILGMGCPKCNRMTELAKKAVSELGVPAEIVKVDRINDIMNYGVMTTPALVVNGVVKLAGRLPEMEELRRWITEAK